MIEIVRGDLAGKRSGFPDLTVVYGPGRYEFVEVKGPNDQLQTNQRLWIQALRARSLPVRVLRFRLAVTRSAEIRIGVKELALFVHRRGDIHYRYEFSALAQEGIARQQDYQRDRPPSYQREVPVSAEFEGLIVSGRIDGWDPDAATVDEVKTTRADPRELHARIGSVNSAQLRLYGGMLALADDTLGPLRLRLVYLHPDNTAETVIEGTTLPGRVGSVSSRRRARPTRLGSRRRTRGSTVATGDYAVRGSRTPSSVPISVAWQRVLFRGFRDGADWLIEAPTGTGKTIASVFPALKAMGRRPSRPGGLRDVADHGPASSRSGLSRRGGRCSGRRHHHGQGAHLLQPRRALRPGALRVRPGLLRPDARRPA